MDTVSPAAHRTKSTTPPKNIQKSRGPDDNEEGLLNAVLADQGQELLSGLGLVTEATKHRRGDCLASWFLHSTHHHAKVASLHDDGDTEGIEQLLHSQSNLLGQTLLNLKTTTEHLCQTRNLAQSNHLSVLWDITNMDLAGERDHVVLTEGENVNVLDNNHLVVILLEERLIHKVGDTLLVTLGEEHESLGITLGSLEETLAVGILSNALQNRTNSSRDLLNACCALSLSILATFPCAHAREAKAVKVDRCAGPALRGL